MVYQNNMQTIFVEEKEMKIAAEIVMEVVKNNPQFFKERSKEMKQLGDEFITKLKSINPIDLTAMTNDDLAGLFDYYKNSYQQIYPRYFPILCIETHLMEDLKSIIDKRKLPEEISSEYFTILTTQPKAMVNLHEELARLNILEKILLNKQWLDLFMHNVSFEKIQEFPELMRLIECHQKEFFWVTRDYEDPILTIQDVIIRLSNNVKNKDIEIIRKKREIVDKHDERVGVAQKELKMTAAEVLKFEIMRDGMYNKEQRKTIVSQSLYYFDKVLEEVAKRTGITLKLIRFMKMDEVLGALNGKEIKRTLEDRYELSIWLPVKGGETQVLTGKEAKKWEEKLFGIDVKADFIQGMGISKGIVTGTARLMMNPNEANRINKGDIIVTVQAVPSFSPAISRAAGIVADGGTGLTSHTATLAREAKIPGVTCAKIATKLIKNGDVIEVNGDTGLVKIIKRI
jgi:phosphohistidine swiveling domain-containing protein